MNINNIVDDLTKISESEILKGKFIKSIKQIKPNLSSKDKRILLKKLSEFRKYDVHYIFCLVLTYSIWSPDEAVEEARKKGIFRYRAWGFEVNRAEMLLKKIEELYMVIAFSEETKKIIDNKLKLGWMFDFYKKSEEELIKYIKQHHQNRKTKRLGERVVEEALFKELLAYADTIFYLGNRSLEHLNKHKIEGYGHEEIAEGISYIIYLYDSIIGIKQDKSYTVSSQYVLSDEIEKVILIACKVNKVQEWEVCVDYFNYNVKSNGKDIFIYDNTQMFEKSIRMGYIKRDMQEQIFYQNNSRQLDKSCLSLAEVGNYIKENLGEQILKEVRNGPFSRYRFEFPEILFDLFKNPKMFQGKFFKEEVLALNFNAREMIMEFDEILETKITNHCNLADILIFQRFFAFLNFVASQILFKQKDEHKIIRSLVPHFTHEKLVDILTLFMGNQIKAKELIQLFTYKKDIKLDLQYTPFIEASGGYFFANSIVSKSNLQRNSIAYSYLSKNLLVNQDDRETLVKECVQIFKDSHPEFQVFENQEFTFLGKEGEIDVLVVSDSELFIIECKSPLSPTNNFEMRASVEHLNKAVKQLDYGKLAFTDKSFRKQYLKSLGVMDKARNIHTCIVFGNRLFNGYNASSHPVRYIRELDMILNNGYMTSPLGNWRIWKNEKFEQEELISFLSPTHTLIQTNFDALEKAEQFMYIKGKKLCFETYAFDFKKALIKYDELFLTKNINKELRKKLHFYY